MILNRRLGCFAVCVCLCSSIAGAQAATSRQAWTSIDVGFGPAGATGGADIVYEGSGQVFARLAYARQIGRKSAVEIDGVVTNPFAAGDCVFTPCGTAFRVAGASVSMVTSVAGPISRDGFNVGAGVGVFRVSTDSYRVSPRGAIGIQTGVEVPVIDLHRSTLMLALRGLGLLPVHGQSLGMALLSLDLHAW
jgi:hypothetical protein